MLAIEARKEVPEYHGSDTHGCGSGDGAEESAAKEAPGVVDGLAGSAPVVAVTKVVGVGDSLGGEDIVGTRMDLCLLVGVRPTDGPLASGWTMEGRISWMSSRVWGRIFIEFKEWCRSAP